MPDPFQLSFVAVGPGRSGTTWLHEALLQHPALCLPMNVKMTRYFERHYEKGLPWYAHHFRHREADQLCGEVCPVYFHVPELPERIKQVSPECRIIITLRDPVSRTLSAYRHYLSNGRVKGSLPEAVQQMPSIVESGKYSVHVRRWLDVFGADAVSFELLDDITAVPASVLESVHDFLGIDRIAPPPGTYEKVATATLSRHRTTARIATGAADWLRARRLYGVVRLGKRLGLKKIYTGQEGSLPELTSADRTGLLAEFEPDISYVEDLLSRNLSAWRNPS